MKLSELLKHIDINLVAAQDREISSLCQHSGEAQAGCLFLAKRGARVSGAQYAQEAVSRGCAAIVTDDELDKNFPVPVFKVSDIAAAENILATVFYQNPSREMTVLGVTGTNGKTTFTYLMQAIARQANLRTGIIGTINYQIPKTSGEEMDILPAPNTTPCALDLQKILRQMAERGAKLVLMEVSSHALALGRVRGVEFDGAIFSNLTQDHLDFHKTMDNYFEAKALLFTALPKTKKPRALCEPFAAVNIDDEYGRRLLPKCPQRILTYGVKNTADVRAENILLEAHGTRFNLLLQGQTHAVHTHLVGLHNVYNILSAVAAAIELGIATAQILKGLETLASVPGRLEVVKNARKKRDFTVVVDYAHTEDALRNVLGALKAFAPARILTVFGCGGDRDKTKRPLMGLAATELSDWTLLTSDNPRSEDPNAILTDIQAGIQTSGRTNYEVLPDRRAAIFKAVSLAREGDIILLAGKGHETYQIYKDKTVHFDDRETAREAMDQ